MTRLLPAGLVALLLAAPAAAQQPDLARNRKQLDAYFRAHVKQINDACLAELTTKDAWEKQRPELRRQFLDMMGLHPLPPRTPLNAVVTGTTDGGTFTVERLHFQSMPGLYVTANLYLPKRRAGRLPTVLYVCGHGNVVIDGVSYGSKVHYQYHPSWFASNGYACLILDTVELAEIRGDHHGTHGAKMWWWQSRGYTPAGVELWNAMRALDYLETRPEVDASKIGVTGRSGGGATSWWVAAADERVKAVVPVAGIADLHAHLVEAPAPRLADGVIAGHCDCMYQVNTYRWDYAQVAALIAPRPLLLGNSDQDDIFPVAGYRRLADKARKVYDLYGAGEKFQLLETKGPHTDTPELHRGINAWMARWLKNDTTEQPAPDLTKRFEPKQLKVFDTLPEPRRNETIHETFVPAATFEPPADAEKLKARREQVWDALREHTFISGRESLPRGERRIAADVTHDGVRLRAIDFAPDVHTNLRVWLATAAGVDEPAEVIFSVLDDAGYKDWCEQFGPHFAEVLRYSGKLTRNDAMFAQNRAAMGREKWGFAAVAPRGIGPTRWAEPGSKEDIHIRRRFPLIGQTLDGQRVLDVEHALSAVWVAAKPIAEDKDRKITVQGKGESAALALYAGGRAWDSKLDLWNLPTSHRTGPQLLNVLRHTDIPEQVALTAAVVPVTLHVVAEADRSAWAEAVRVSAATGGRLTVKVGGE
ncbi:MAG: prolyl oligopeptidase family serine peptidase [Gemmataceae bacterium]